MSKNVNVNGVDYTGVSQVQLKTTSGGTALFKDVDEITTPSGTINITANGTHDVTKYASAVVNVSSGETDSFESVYAAVVDGSVSGNLVIPSTVETIRTGAFKGLGNVTSVEIPDSVTTIGTDAFSGCSNLVITELPPNLVELGQGAFYFTKAAITEIPASVKRITGSFVFAYAQTTNLTFKGTPDEIGGNALSSVSVVNVPWSEGEVANAPWGATTVNYNYTGA